MAYGQMLYRTLQFGEEATDRDEALEFKRDLMAYLPDYYKDSHQMNALQATAGEEVSEFRYRVDEQLDQLFLDTATWGLVLWESELGLDTERTQSYEWRREMLRAKLRGTGTTTRQMIIEAAAAFSGGEVDVADHPEEARFEIHFIGVKGIPANMAGFIRLLEEIKPAHLSYSFEYTYSVWNALKQLTWQQAQSKTWAQLRTFTGV
ncbi:putative phage tail protein [Paenibacillus puerhi]|uniref:putative phage tail protein n=1 Tax=Paenibacillus puerhi TaxID=2692622 RepID=UPI001F3A05F7|nr:putative phage tail protein [Paenibacillus puerhi]